MDGGEADAPRYTYTDAVLDLMASEAVGRGVAAKVSTTGAVEAAAALMGRAFASAALTPEIPGVNPSILAMMGREIVRRGEAVFSIEVDARGLRLAPVTDWEITGQHEPGSWFYSLRLAGPSTDTERSAPSAGVVHVRPYVEPSAPWRGIPPIQAASLTARLLAETETALADESAGPRGSVIPLPNDYDIDKMKADINRLAGRVALPETTAGGWGEGKGAAPQADWQPRRIGANPPETLRALRIDAEASMLAALGVPVELTGGKADGAAVREAWRRFAHATLTPIGEHVAAELGEKLERPGLSLSFDRLFASDITGRARAFASMVAGGMETDKAASLSGLLAGE